MESTVTNFVKRQRSTNFSQHETDVLKHILSQYSIIENKSKTMQVEWEKKAAWRSIAENFNSHKHVNQRDERQLKNAWKKLKAMAKSELNGMLKQRIAGSYVARPYEAEQQTSNVNTTQSPIAIKDEPSFSISTCPDVSTDLTPLPIHGLYDNSYCVKSSESVAESESKSSSPNGIVLGPQLLKRPSSDDRKAEMEEEKHRLKVRILETELENKLLERKYRLKEHEATLRNLEAVFEKEKNDNPSASNATSNVTVT